MPHSNPAGTVNVVHLTDAHLFASPEGSMLGLNTRDSLRHVVQQALREQHDTHLLVCTGTCPRTPALRPTQPLSN